MEPSTSIEQCQICEQKAHGKHFGAITCRACAAFFRRVGASNSLKPCKKSNKCTFLKSGWFNCKKCRLEKCKSMGMTIDNFQYHREGYTSKIPHTINTLLGEFNLIIFSSSSSSTKSKKKNYFNVEFLLEEAKTVLSQGALPLQSPRVLSKLALGLRDVRGKKMGNRKVISKFGREEVMGLWQKDLLKVAKWLNYFDPFKQLPGNVQLILLKSMWHMWCRLESVSLTAIGRRHQLCDPNQIMTMIGNQTLVVDMNHLELDLTWCSDYTAEELRFFIPNDHTPSEMLVQMIQDTEPTDEELSYLLCQVCFHFVKKKHSGEIVEVMERFEEKVADDLHDYYVNELRMPRYCGRLTKLMKINNKLHEIFYREKVRKELAIVFDVFNVQFSHPELFRDGWEIESS